MQLAVMWGARVLVLVGFDYDDAGAHFFGEHPETCRKEFHAKDYRAATNQVIGELAAGGIPTVNCSPTRKLICKSLPLGETLARLRADP